ncbi:MAG: ABC transporter permease [Candidatus Thermoplasmatota archaeon]|nr:ABC transporter permease [Candidatus Thermoplasmatota archaeon]
MRLRSFLIRRALHTVITLVIILILLFIIFRMMPGDPTRFFIEPGQTPEVRDRLLVDFGFSRWETAPGVYRLGSFNTFDVGAYGLRLEINSTGLVDPPGLYNITLYSSYVKEERFFPSKDSLVIWNTTYSDTPTGNITVGDTVDFTFDVKAQGDMNRIVTMTLVRNEDLNQTEEYNLTSHGTQILGSPNWGRYTTTVDTDQAGFYRMELSVYDPVSQETETVEDGYAVNPSDITPFELVTSEGGMFTSRNIFAETIGEFTIAVKVDADGKLRPVADSGLIVFVTTPAGEVSTLKPPEQLFHPQIVVELPVWEQFWEYFTDMITGDFGISFFSKRPVWTEIEQRAPATVLLFGTALALSALLGIGVGAILAWRRGSSLEMSAIVVSLFFYSMPLFWFGLILLWGFGFILQWFPLGGIGGQDAQGNALGGLAYIADILWHMTLPLVTLMMVSLAGYVLLMRNSMLEVLGEDYIMTAKAKGLSERTVMYKHAARNALLPVATVIALGVGGVISGGVLTETIFSWPGMGYFLVTSTIQQDYPAVQGTFFLLAIMTVIANVAADVLYAFLDPRVRL